MIKEERYFEIFLITYRLFICFFSLNVISKLTILGDYKRYINGNPLQIFYKNHLNFIFDSTLLTDFLVGGTKNLFFGSEILTSIFFNLIGSCGIIYFLNCVSWNRIMYFFILLPSFTIWSSYPSKEVISVFSTGIIMGNIIKIFNDEKRKIKDNISLCLSFFLLFIYKKQYLIVIIFLLIYWFLKDKINFKTRIIIYILYLISLVIIFYILRDKIDFFFKNFHDHFNYGSEKTVRNLTFFEEKYGFYKHMLYGVFICFFGPSIWEIQQGGLKLFSFIESSMIITILCYLITKSKNKSAENLFLVLNSLFLLLLPQYPFGIFNSGSAIRYRTNLWLIFLGIVYIFIINKKNVKIIKYFNLKRRVL